MVIPLFVGREKSIHLLRNCDERQQTNYTSCAEDASTDEPGVNDLFSVGDSGFCFTDAETA